MSKLAHAGESSTASPGRAELEGARRPLPRMLAARSIGSAGDRKRPLDHGASRPISTTRARRAGDGRRERREILPLAVAARDQHDLAAAAVQLPAEPDSAATVAPTLVPFESS